MSVSKGCSYQACHLLFEQNAQETKQGHKHCQFFYPQKGKVYYRTQLTITKSLSLGISDENPLNG